MQSYTLKEIANALGAETHGNAALRVTGAAEPSDAGQDRLALAMDPKYADGIGQGKARAALLWDGADWQALGLEGAITVPRARVAMSALTQFLDPGPNVALGIHPTAVIDDSASVGEGAAVGPFVVVGADVKIGANARIASHVSIAEGSRIGSDVLLHAGARIGRNVRIGDRFIAHPSAVIGADGFSFVTAEKSRAEAARETMGDASEAEAQPWLRIHSLGAVIIGDDVEIGANACVDAGTIKPHPDRQRHKNRQPSPCGA